MKTFLFTLVFERRGKNLIHGNKQHWSGGIKTKPLTLLAGNEAGKKLNHTITN